MAQTSAIMSVHLLDFVREGLCSRKGQWREIARAAKVPYDTVSKIARGANKEPGVLKVQRLADHLRQLDERTAA
jgi:hypothetical protein